MLSLAGGSGSGLAYLVVEGVSAAHFRNVVGRMEIVTVDKGCLECQPELNSDRRFPAIEEDCVRDRVGGAPASHMASN